MSDPRTTPWAQSATCGCIYNPHGFLEQECFECEHETVAVPLARRSDPDTSHIAAASFDPESLKTRILMALAIFQFGATTHEVASFLKADLVSVSPRMRPLVNAGKIRDSGRRDRAQGRSPRIIWEIVS